MTHARPSIPPAILAALLAGITPIALVACSATRASRETLVEAGPFDPDRALERAIRREVRHPSQPARTAPPPPGLDAGALAPISEDRAGAYARAHMPLELALAEVDEFFPSAPEAAPLDVPPDERRRAIALYARGRAMRLDGQHDAAIKSLEAAARLDPDAAAPWREIGEARLALSDRHGAAIAFSRAFDRDPTDVRVLEQLAALPATEADDHRAAAILARLYRAGPDDADPALEYLVPARLGGALLNLGYLSAGVQLLENAVTLPDRFDAPSNRAQDLAALYRRRGDLWTTIGDANMRLSDPARALRAYSEAAHLPSLDPSGLLLRRVHAAMRLGRPATAGTFILERMAGLDARADDRLIETLAYVARHSDIADELDGAIRSLEASLPDEERRLAGAAIVRARAAVLPAERAILIYREHLAEHPSDETVLSGLFQRLALESPERALREAISLTAQNPLRDDELVGALLRAVPDPAELIGAWSALDEQTRATAPARLIRARLLSVAKRPGEADRVLQQILDDRPGYPPALIARVRLLEVLDRGREADALLRSIDPGADVGLAYAKALALAERRDLAESESVVQSALAIAAPDDPRRIDLLLLGAELATGAGDPALAERRYRQVLEAQPAREEAHAGLIQLYASSGPLADDRKLVGQLASLRDTNPSSRLLRTLRAREALARGQFDLAEHDLLDLAEQFPDDEQAINTLVQLWIQTGAQDRAELWLQRQIDRFPARNTYLILLAQTYLSQDRNAEAAKVLDDWLTQFPGDVRVSERLEQIYEQRLGDSAAANRLRIRRLENAGDSDATAAERAKIYFDLEQYDKFVAATRQATEHALRTGADISDWATQTIATLYRVARRGGCPPDVAAEAQGIICGALDSLPAEAYLMRLEILARVPEPKLDEVRQALDRAAALHPTSVTNAYRVAVMFLTEPYTLHQINAPEREDAPRRALRPSQRDEVLSRFALAAHIADDAAGLPDLPPQDRAMVLALQYRTLYTALLSGALADLPKSDAMARRLVEAPNKDAILDAINSMPLTDPSTARAPDPRRRSQLAEAIGQVLNSMGDEAGADTYDELALRYDPDNATVNNNYGYRLLERNDPQRLDDALRMIQRAYEASEQPPPHVIDSLGWARYKAGLIHDVVDENGDVVTPGAVTLLTRALKLAENPSNQDSDLEIPILSSHLADALWLAGQREKAIDSWRATIRLGRRAIETPEAELFPASVLDELRRAITSAQDKIDAARADRQPPIAPVLRPVNQPGAQDADAAETPTDDESAPTPAPITDPPGPVEPGAPGDPG